MSGTAPDRPGVRPLAHDLHRPTHAEFSPDGSLVLVGGWAAAGGAVGVFETATGNRVGAPVPLASPNSFATFAPAPPEVLVRTVDGGVVQVWGCRRPGSPVHSWQAHDGRVTVLGLDADGTGIVSAGGDGAVKVWEAREPATRRVVIDTGSAVAAARIASGGRVLVTVGEDGVARRWDARSGRAVGPPVPLTDAGSLPQLGSAPQLALSPDGRFGMATRSAGPAVLFRLPVPADGEVPEIGRRIRQRTGTEFESGTGGWRVVPPPGPHP